MMNLSKEVLSEAVNKLKTIFPDFTIGLGSNNHILIENPNKKTRAAITYELFVTCNLKLFTKDELLRGMKLSYPQLF